MTDKDKIKQEIERLSDEYPMSRGLLKHLTGFIDSLPEEHISEDLTHAAYHYANNLNMKRQIQLFEEKDVATDFIAGAEWQHGKDFDDLLQSEMKFPKEFYEKGRSNMREEMMKDAVLETKVMMDCDGDGIETPYEEWLTLEDTEIPYIPNNLGLKEGDKVKIIIVKDE